MKQTVLGLSLVLLSDLALLSLLGCGRLEHPPATTTASVPVATSAADEPEKPLVIFAAASTTDVIEELAKAYERRTGVEVLSSFASSSTLARQIEQGAKADLFLSANKKWMDYLQEKQLIQNDTRKDLLGNRMVIIAGKTGDVKKWESIAPLPHYTDKLAMGDPDHVPAGIYGKEALTKLGLWDKISPQVVPTRNVRSTLLLVETGQAPLGVVYATDAAASDKVAVVFVLPAETHTPVHYPIALTKDGSKNAVAFETFLQSDEAAEIFRKAGFEVVQ